MNEQVVEERVSSLLLDENEVMNAQVEFHVIPENLAQVEVQVQVEAEAEVQQNVVA